MPNINREELAWAAGFFDGEGSFSVRVTGVPRVTIGQNDRDVLDKFAVCVGTGKVYGPYQKKINPGWQYEVNSFEATQFIACALWPWLSDIKKHQAKIVLEVHKARKQLRRREKLDAIQVKAIRSSSAAGWILAKEFGVSTSTINLVKRGLRYAKV